MERVTVVLCLSIIDACINVHQPLLCTDNTVPIQRLCLCGRPKFDDRYITFVVRFSYISVIVVIIIIVDMHLHTPQMVLILETTTPQ